MHRQIITKNADFHSVCTDFFTDIMADNRLLNWQGGLAISLGGLAYWKTLGTMNQFISDNNQGDIEWNKSLLALALAVFCGRLGAESLKPITTLLLVGLPIFMAANYTLHVHPQKIKQGIAMTTGAVVAGGSFRLLTGRGFFSTSNHIPHDYKDTNHYPRHLRHQDSHHGPQKPHTR